MIASLSQVTNIKAWAKLVLVAWAMLASIIALGSGLWLSHVRGKLAETNAHWEECQRVNTRCNETVDAIQADLQQCEAEWAEVQRSEREDERRAEQQSGELRQRVDELQRELRQSTAASDDPALDECLGVPVPGGAAERLRRASGRAAPGGGG